RSLQVRCAGVGLVVLAVPDARIAEVGERLAPRLDRGTVLVHCAGARSAEELSAQRSRGICVGAMHPLVSFADRKRRPELTGTTRPSALIATRSRTKRRRCSPCTTASRPRSSRARKPAGSRPQKRPRSNVRSRRLFGGVARASLDRDRRAGPAETNEVSAT